MDDAARMAEAQQQALGLFADALLKLGLHLVDEALGAEDVDQKVKLTGAADRLGRGFRQTVALQAKIGHDARREARREAEDLSEAANLEPPAQPQPSDPTSVALRRRGDWLTRGVERCVWNEYDPQDEAEELIGDSLLVDFREHLADLMADPEAFLALDPDTLLVDLCKALGLTPPQFVTPAPKVPAHGPSTAPPARGPDSS